MKDQIENFQDNVKKYLIHDFNNQRGIIIVVQDLKEPYAHVVMDNPSNLSKVDKEDVILIAQLQEEANDYVKRVRIINKNMPKLYVILWGQFNPRLHNEVQGEPVHDNMSESFY